MSVPLKEESNEPLSGGTPSFLKRDDWESIVSNKIQLREYYQTNKLTASQMDEMKGFIQNGGKFVDSTEAVSEIPSEDNSEVSITEHTEEHVEGEEPKTIPASSEIEKPYYNDGIKYPSYQKYRDQQDKLNQKIQFDLQKHIKGLDESKSRKESLSKQRADINRTKASDDDYLDPKTKVHEDILDRTLASNEESETLRVREHEAKIAELQTQLMFSEISSLQNEYAELKTTVPINQLNDEISDFEQRIGGAKNRERYFSDKAYRDQVNAQGVGLSKDFTDNQDAFNKITRLHNMKVGDPANGKLAYPDYESAYLKLSKSERKSDLAKAKLDGRNEAIEKLSSRKTKSGTVAPGTGGNGLSNPSLTKKGYSDLMNSLKGKRATSDDIAQLDKYREAAKQGTLK